MDIEWGAEPFWYKLTAVCITAIVFTVWMGVDTLIERYKQRQTKQP